MNDGLDGVTVEMDRPDEQSGSANVALNVGCCANGHAFVESITSGRDGSGLVIFCARCGELRKAN